MTIGNKLYRGSKFALIRKDANLLNGVSLHERRLTQYREIINYAEKRDTHRQLCQWAVSWNCKDSYRDYNSRPKGLRKA